MEFSSRIMHDHIWHLQHNMNFKEWDDSHGLHIVLGQLSQSPQPARTIQDLRIQIEEAWNSIPQSDIELLYDRIDVRIGECATVQGVQYHTNHVPFSNVLFIYFLLYEQMQLYISIYFLSLSLLYSIIMLYKFHSYQMFLTWCSVSNFWQYVYKINIFYICFCAFINV